MTAITGTWVGTFNDEDGGGTMRWDISTQSGSSFGGRLSVNQNDQSASGTLTGAVLSEDVTFRFAVDGCPNACPGEGRATLRERVLSGTYQATNLLGRSVNGQFSLTPGS